MRDKVPASLSPRWRWFLIGQVHRRPDGWKGKNKSSQERFARNAFRIIQNLDRCPWAIDVDLLAVRIEKPSEFRTVVAIFLQLFLLAGQGVGRRAEFDHEIGTEWKEFAALLGGESM